MLSSCSCFFVFVYCCAETGNFQELWACMIGVRTCQTTNSKCCKAIPPDVDSFLNTTGSLWQPTIHVDWSKNPEAAGVYRRPGSPHHSFLTFVSCCDSKNPKATNGRPTIHDHDPLGSHWAATGQPLSVEEEFRLRRKRDLEGKILAKAPRFAASLGLGPI